MEDARARRRAAELDGDEFASSGAHLRAVREAAGLSIEEISERTHIKAAFIDAIELMNFDALPSRPFAIGFVKVYAETLGLDARALVSRFKEDAGLSTPVEIPSEKFEATQTVGEPERSELSLLAFVAIIAFILWCAFQITRPRDVTRPFNLNTPAAESHSAAQPAEAGPAPAPAPAARAPAANVVEAKLIETIEPVYPQRCEARAEPVETVEIAFNITPAGTISGERVVTASNGCFETAALNAARRWRFEPRKVDGAPATAYDKRYTFTFARPN